MSSNLKTLVLNCNYVPISIFPLATIPAEDAVVRCYNQELPTCHVVTEYDRFIKTKSDFRIRWPSVIARNDNKIIGNYVKLTREFIYFRDWGKCQYCEERISPSQMTLDHVVPRGKGGKHSWANVVASCEPCNSRKGDKLPVGEWKPISTPRKPTYWEMVERRRNFPITLYSEDWLQFIGDWKAEVKILTGEKNGMAVVLA